MIRLGSFDTNVGQDARAAYLNTVSQVTRVNLTDIKDGEDKLKFSSYAPDNRTPMTVAQVQQALKDLGFFPGGHVDGICGYRTLSAIRLFQEYVRTVEGQSSLPDGIFGPNAQGHLRRWIDNGLRPDWDSTVANWRAGTLNPAGEFNQWLALGNKVKAKYQANPTRMLQMVNDNTFANSDTLKVNDWTFDPNHMHIFGIRRNELSGKFDDIFIFLIKGLVFKFQGSTEPGASSHERGRPFLVQGQSNYHFGWHQKRYLALRPLSMFKHNGGVLVVRSQDRNLDEHDLLNGLEPNGSINVHWAGKGSVKGVNFNVGNWSEGCQVITGSVYANHHNRLIDCQAFVAKNNGEVGGSKTRGAYNVLLDVATALSSDMGSNTVKYMLLNEEDLNESPALRDGLMAARQDLHVMMQG